MSSSHLIQINSDLPSEDREWFHNAILADIFSNENPNIEQAHHLDKNAKVKTSKKYYDVVFNYARLHTDRMTLQLVRILLMNPQMSEFFLQDEANYDKYLRYYFGTMDDEEKRQALNVCNNWFNKFKFEFKDYDESNDKYKDMNQLYAAVNHVAAVKSRLLNRLPKNINKAEFEKHFNEQSKEFHKTLHKKNTTENMISMKRYGTKMDKLNKGFNHYMGDLIINHD